MPISFDELRGRGFDDAATAYLNGCAENMVAAERERCAKIAEVVGSEYTVKNKLSQGIELAGHVIAAAIRHPPKEDPP